MLNTMEDVKHSNQIISSPLISDHTLSPHLSLRDQFDPETGDSHKSRSLIPVGSLQAPRAYPEEDLERSEKSDGNVSGRFLQEIPAREERAQAAERGEPTDRAPSRAPVGQLERGLEGCEGGGFGGVCRRASRSRWQAAVFGVEEGKREEEECKAAGKRRIEEILDVLGEASSAVCFERGWRWGGKAGEGRGGEGRGGEGKGGVCGVAGTASQAGVQCIKGLPLLSDKGISQFEFSF